MRDCPREPHIPIYMVVGGSVGCIKMAWLIYSQLSSKHQHSPSPHGSSVGSKIISFGLSLFLIVWFILGNYWILHIKWPEYTPTLFDPNRWCHRTLYVFSLIHLYVMYFVFGLIGMTTLTLAMCQLVGCPWLGTGTYK